VRFFAIPLSEDLSAMDEKRSVTKDEPHKPADTSPASAKAAVDALIKQLRAVPGQPALLDRADAIRGWSTFDRVLVAVAVLVLFALAVVYVALWRAPPRP
jgi:hypothetical protein